MCFQIEGHRKYYQDEVWTFSSELLFYSSEKLDKYSFLYRNTIDAANRSFEVMCCPEVKGVRVTENSFSWSSVPVGGCRMKTSINNRIA